MNFKRLLLRSWYYFRFGYSTYLSFPVAIIAYSSSIYYLAIANIPMLEQIFPRFHIFLIVALVTLPPVAVILAWFHFKKILSSLYKAERDIVTEADPYSTCITTPVNLPLYKTVSQIAKKHSIDTKEIDAIIEATEKKFR